MNCVFCKIINEEIPAHIIAEDENVIVFLSLENHPLIVPKKHLVDIFALDNDTASAIMQMSLRVAPATKEGLGSDGIYVTQANGEHAGQDVFHYHMHIYPRWADGRHMPTDEESKKLTAEKIRNSFK